MIKRIVKMQFQKSGIDQFKAIFETGKEKILQFDGCTHLELWQDKNDAQTFFTYSIWESEDHLNHYRNSSFFKNIWPQTKALFQSKPKAWTLNVLDD